MPEVREAHLLRLLVHPVGELGPVLRRHVVVVGDQVGNVGQRRDRLEVLQRIVGLLEAERGVGRQRRRAEQQRLAVGLGLGHQLHADDGVAAAAVLDDHLLAEQRRHLLGDQAARRVGGAARDVGHHDLDLAALGQACARTAEAPTIVQPAAPASTLRRLIIVPSLTCLREDRKSPVAAQCALGRAFYSAGFERRLAHARRSLGSIEMAQKPRNATPASTISSTGKPAAFTDRADQRHHDASSRRSRSPAACR